MMLVTAKRVIRTLQVHFPALIEARWAAQRAYLRLRRKPHEPDFRLLKSLTFAPDEVLIDVGANRGQSIESMRLYEPDRRIIAFEPNDRLAQRLHRYRCVTVHAAGLGDETGQFTLHVPSYNGWEFDAQASLAFTEQNMDYLRWSIIGFDERKLSVRAMPCAVYRLDSFRLRAGFIKIDAEGFEPRVIAGGRETIRARLPALLIENSASDEVCSSLAEIGYIPFNMGHGELRPGIIGYRNTVYLHPARHGDVMSRTTHTH